jgi:hypothetical protein
MKQLLAGVCLLFLTACAGYELPYINYENKESGVKIETSEDGKICVDDGKDQSGCVQLKKKETKDGESN